MSGGATVAGANGLAAEVGAITHPGRVRPSNEDRFFVSPERGLFAVADGMGGHEAGEVASAAIVDALAALGPTRSASDLLDDVEAAILRVNAVLHRMGAERGTVVGSTAAILMVHGREYACLWCGDSRIYRVRGGGIALLSRDHTEAQDLVARGVLSPEEARNWPRRNVLTRAVGGRPDLQLALDDGWLEPGDTFIVCSDGLTGHVTDDEILAQARRGAAAQATCEALVGLTLDRGAGDNVTVVVVRIGAGR